MGLRLSDRASAISWRGGCSSHSPSLNVGHLNSLTNVVCRRSSLGLLVLVSGVIRTCHLAKDSSYLGLHTLSCVLQWNYTRNVFISYILALNRIHYSFPIYPDCVRSRNPNSSLVINKLYLPFMTSRTTRFLVSPAQLVVVLRIA